LGPIISEDNRFPPLRGADDEWVAPRIAPESNLQQVLARGEPNLGDGGTLNIKYWLRRPHLIWPRLKYWLWEITNRDKPWLCPGAVDYCTEVLTKSMQAIEFGSGRSTAWFAQRVGRLTTVEHSPRWYARVRSTLEQKQLSRVDCRLVPLDHPEAEAEHETYEPLPSYVRVLNEFPDDSLDLVVVDGHYRSTCIRASLAKLKGSGLLLVDDVNMWGGFNRVPIPDLWTLVHRSSNGLKETGIWQKPVGNA
jgi:hypothetical protein